jgi:hypothetical protein
MTWVTHAWRRFLRSSSSWQAIAARAEARAVGRSLRKVGIDNTQLAEAIPLVARCLFDDRKTLEKTHFIWLTYTYCSVFHVQNRIQVRIIFV